MPSLSPTQIAFLIVAVVGGIGFILALRQHRSTFSGYESIAADVRAITRSLRGEISREEDDLVISGNFSRLPAVVRFSNADFSPGLNVRVQAPATFSMSAIPAGTTVPGAGRAVLRSNDPAFDSRFTLRSDTPTEARMFLEPVTVAALKQLCCSNKTHVSIGHGAIEISELIIPEPYTARHVLDHLKQIGQLVASLREMPGAEALKVEPFRRERHWATRISIAVGAVAALVIVFTATGGPAKPPAAIVSAAPEGVLPVDAAMIPDIRKWRLATKNDFNPTVLNWMRGNGLEPEARISGDFSGNDAVNDVAYMLMNQDGTLRVVLIGQGAVRYDAQFRALAGVVLLPKENVAGIDWAGGKPPDPIDGDGVLLIRSADDGASALGLFLRGGRPIFASPVNYDTISLR